MQKATSKTFTCNKCLEDCSLNSYVIMESFVRNNKKLINSSSNTCIAVGYRFIYFNFSSIIHSIHDFSLFVSHLQKNCRKLETFPSKSVCSSFQ